MSIRGGDGKGGLEPGISGWLGESIGMVLTDEAVKEGLVGGDFINISSVEKKGKLRVRVRSKGSFLFR
jgi:hypothetical protein